MTADPITQDSWMISSARTAIDFIDRIKNTEINGQSLHTLRTSIEILLYACNSEPLKTFPVKITDRPIDEVGFETRSTYSKINFSEVPNFVIDSLGQAEKQLDDGQCLDALRVLIDYCNIVVYSRFERGLVISPAFANGVQL